MKKVLTIAVLVLSFLLPFSNTTTGAAAWNTPDNNRALSDPPYQALINTFTTLSSDRPTATLTQTVTLRARVLESTGFTPAGMIEFWEGTERLGEGAVSSTGWATLTVTNFSAGSHTLTAVYSGDETFAGSTSDAFTQIIEKIPSILSVTLATPNPSYVGQPVTVDVSARAAAGFSGSPTGTVTVTSDGQTCAVNLTNGTGSCEITFFSVGAKTLALAYPGDDRFQGDDDVLTEQTVLQAYTSTQIESFDPAEPALGQTVSVNVRVTANSPAGGTPTGTVQVYGLPGETCTVTNLDSNGRGSCTFIVSALGERSVQARYLVTDNYRASFTNRVLTVTKGLTSVSIIAPTPITSTLNQPVQIYFRVTKLGHAAQVPTGSVTIRMGDSIICTVNALPASGSGSCGFTPSSAESIALTADYSGDDNYAGDSSETHTLEVNKISTNVVIDAVTPNPSLLGQTVTFTFHVTPSEVSGPLTGTVTILDEGTPFCSAAVESGSCSNAFHSLGEKSLSASYSGNSIYQEDTSDPVLLTVNGQNTFADPNLSCGGRLPCFPTIQQAIDGASPGYSVSVYPGEYSEVVNVGKNVAVTLLGSVTISGSLSINDGVWTNSPESLIVTGDLTQTGGTFDANGGTLEMGGASGQSLTLLDPVHTLTINSLDGVVMLGAPLDIDGSLTLVTGTLDVSEANYPIHLSGNLGRSTGSFNPRHGTLTLDGAEQTISGANTFYNLTRRLPGTLTFPAGLAQTITGVLDLQGVEGSPLILRSSAPGNRWLIDPQAGRTLAYLDVQDSSNIHPLRINALSCNSVTSGNNSGWNFFAPQIDAQSANVTEGQDQILTLTASDRDGDPLTLTVLALPAYGRLYQYENGRGAEITEVPAAVTDTQHRLIYAFTQDGPAQDTFNIRASDGLEENSAAFTLNRTMVNDPPVISTILEQHTPEDTALGPLSFTVTDEETPAAELVVTAASERSELVPPAGLVLGGSGTNRTLRITPALNQHGGTNITLSVQDEGTEPVTMTFLLTVDPVNDTPGSGNSAVDLDEDSTYTFQPADFPFSDSVDGDIFGGIRVTETVTSGTLAADGFAVRSGDLIPDVSKLTFAPEANLVGVPYTSFKFQARDSAGSFSPVYTMTLNVTALNDAPVAVNDTYGTDEDQTLTENAENGLLSNDSDIDSDLLTVLLVTQPAKGTLTLQPDGSFTYVPDRNEHGSDSFTYRTRDGELQSSTATVTIEIQPVDDPPVLTLGALPEAEEGESLSFTANYIDPDDNQNDLAPGLTLEWDFGDGTILSGGLTATHAYADDGTYTITARVKNSTGQVLSTDSGSLAVANVAPLVDAGGDGAAVKGSPFTRAGTFNDPGADTWTATVDYGDGSGEQALALTGKTFTLEHTYTQGGTYTVIIQVQDNGSQPGVAILQVVVTGGCVQFVPIVLR